MYTLPRYGESVIPIEKFTHYALDPIKSGGKWIAFRDALGYNLLNAPMLVENIRNNLVNFPAEDKGDNGYGNTYTVLMELTGVNGKTANVMTAWLDDRKTGEIRLISAYVKKRRSGND